MSEQPTPPTDPEREHSGGDPHHDPTQDAPEVGEQRETRRERGDDEEDSEDG
jgi:hypothetical protein